MGMKKYGRLLSDIVVMLVYVVRKADDINSNFILKLLDFLQESILHYNVILLLQETHHSEAVSILIQYDSGTLDDDGLHICNFNLFFIKKTPAVSNSCFARQTFTCDTQRSVAGSTSA